MVSFPSVNNSIILYSKIENNLLRVYKSMKEKKKNNASFGVSPELHEQMKTEAKIRGESFSAFIRWMFEEYLKNN